MEKKLEFSDLQSILSNIIFSYDINIPVEQNRHGFGLKPFDVNELTSCPTSVLLSLIMLV